MKIKLGKTYITRDNRKIRIICTDKKSMDDTPVVGLLPCDENTESFALYHLDGRYFNSTPCNLDLVEEYSELAEKD